RGPLHPRGRAGPRDAGRAGRQRGRALYLGVRARLVPGRPRRRPHQPDARHHAGHGHGSHRRGVRGRRDRRPRLVLGHLPRRAHLRAGALLRHPLLPALLHLLVGSTGLVSFGHAAYFGIGAYTTGILMTKLSVPFLLAFPAAGVLAAAFALLFGLFCVRLTRIYFAMLTLAFAQIVWAICF